MQKEIQKHSQKKNSQTQKKQKNNCKTNPKNKPPLIPKWKLLVQKIPGVNALVHHTPFPILYLSLIIIQTYSADGTERQYSYYLIDFFLYTFGESWFDKRRTQWTQKTKDVASIEWKEVVEYFRSNEYTGAQRTIKASLSNYFLNAQHQQHQDQCSKFSIDQFNSLKTKPSDNLEVETITLTEYRDLLNTVPADSNLTTNTPL